MTHSPMTRLLALVAAASIAGCASAPETAPPATHSALDCSQIEAQIGAAEQARQAALEKEQDAWKVVIPFAVAARYASSKAAVSEADERLAQLRAESTRRGCARHDG